MEAAQVSISRRVDKTTMRHVHNGILLGHKKESFAIWDSMNGPGEHYAKCKSQSEKDRYHMISLVCGI